MTDKLTDAQIEEILRGTEGVTPGPWVFSGVRATWREMTVQPIIADDDMKIGAFAGLVWSEKHSAAVLRDGKHIARLDPATVVAAFTELAQLRASDKVMREAPAWRDVVAERERQKSVEGWTAQHNDRHTEGQMALAAAAYAYASQYPDALRAAVGRPNWWPWSDDWWRPTSPRRDLVKAGALILAEIERLDRAALRPNTDGETP